jgi:hypothetical protein
VAGDAGESGLLGDSGESGLLGDSGDSGLADGSAAVVVSEPVSAGLARRGPGCAVNALSAVVASGEATLATARTARVALSGSIACSSSSSASSRSHTALSGGIVTEADAL